MVDSYFLHTHVHNILHNNPISREKQALISTINVSPAITI